MSENGYDKNLANIQKQEEHKRMLHDRTIGGQDVPRPSREFIELHTGSLKSNADMEKQARAETTQQWRNDEAQRQQRSQVEQSMRDHQTRLEAQQRDRDNQKALDERKQKENEQRQQQKDEQSLESQREEKRQRYRAAFEQARNDRDRGM